MTSDRQGAWTRLLERFGMCDMTAQNLIMCRVLQSAIEGDIKAATFIRDTLMMTSGGIEGGEESPFVFPFTPSGQERMAQYQFYEIKSRHDIMRPLLDEAFKFDRASCQNKRTDRLQEMMVQSAKAAHREGRLTIDEETGVVTLRLVQKVDDDSEAENAGVQ